MILSKILILSLDLNKLPTDKMIIIIPFMGKKYKPVPNEKRATLIHLIHDNNMSISKAAQQTGIFYPTAKAINKVYLLENRVAKKSHRTRLT